MNIPDRPSHPLVKSKTLHDSLHIINISLLSGKSLGLWRFHVSSVLAQSTKTIPSPSFQQNVMLIFTRATCEGLSTMGRIPSSSFHGQHACRCKGVSPIKAVAQS